MFSLLDKGLSETGLKRAEKYEPGGRGVDEGHVTLKDFSKDKEVVLSFSKITPIAW